MPAFYATLINTRMIHFVPGSAILCITVLFILCTVYGAFFLVPLSHPCSFDISFQ